ncbi:linker for activation of T-cells family member 1 [Heteronotia binoei]|uniref:linker for activation of T-cells family member 1 n=1 Tax=Heteronotia binoei TaxID=13085 RepID=UPI00292EE7F7|nr:linker for activation of T-cells family member 1 [Heteronotia binoei]
MDTFQTDANFLVWLLTFTVPSLVVLLVLCIGCRDPESDMPPIDDYQYKPHSSGQHETFRVLRRNPSPPCAPVQRQPDLQRCPPQNPPRPAVPFGHEDNRSIPSYENEEQPCATDDDENYVPGYIEVLPDAPVEDQGNRDGASTGSIGDQYENISESPASSRHSLGEYVNVLEPDPTILDFCVEGGNSDLESEDDTPDYENIICPRI